MKHEDLLSLAEDITALEPLEKKCPRCGGASANSSNSAGRCSGCLKKLKTNKKNPNRYEHHHKIADDALKRQDGKTKTSDAKSSGRGSRESIIRQTKAAYAKHGKSTVLSPDRKDNSKGYSADNTRLVPQKLNHGRHNVDNKKLKRWKEKVSKSDITFDELKELMLAKITEANSYLKKHIENLTIEQLIKLSSNQ